MNVEFEYEKQPGLRRKCYKSSSIPHFVSIITPFYNAGKYFEQTFNCVMNQTFEWFEWIIVDDGSTNEADLAILEKLAVTDSRIKLYHIENRGPAGARNYAVSKSNTDIIVPLDADDLIEAVYLEETFFALYFNPTASWAYTDSVGFGELQYVWKVPFDSRKLKRKNFLINIGTIRKKAFLEVGGYDDARRYSHEDWNLWLRFLARGDYPIHIGSVLAWYRISSNGALHETNDSKKTKKRAYERIHEVAKKISTSIDATEYPRTFKMEKNRKITCSKWDCLKEKKSYEILLLLPSLQKEYIKLLDNLNIENVHIGIMTTEISAFDSIQEFSAITDDVFELCTFLDIDAYPEFISYYIKSRRVDVVLTYGSEYGSAITLWLKGKFPDLFCNEFEKITKDCIIGAVDRVKEKSQEKETERPYKEMELLNQYADKYIEAYTDKTVCQNMYYEFQKKVEAHYEKEKRKKIRYARFLDTKFGSLINEIIGLNKA